MKKGILFLIVLFLGCGGWSVAPQPASTKQPYELDRVIIEISDYLNERIPHGIKVAFVSARKEFPVLSEYIVESITENAVNNRAFIVVDRTQLDAIRSELQFQTSGEVSDESVRSIGRFLGAKTIVTVAVSQVGNIYRVGVRALDVESAEIQGLINKNIQHNSTVSALAETSIPVQPSPADIAAARVHVRNGNNFLTSGDNNRNAADYDRALAEFEQAARLDPNNAAAHFGIGRSYLRKRNNERAIVAYSRALELNPNDAIALSNRGRAYSRLGNFERAIADFEAAYRIDPNNNLIRQNLERARQGLPDTPTP